MVSAPDRSLTISSPALRRRQLQHALATLVVPAAGLVAGIVGWGVSGPTWLDLAMLVGMYAATMTGVACGFHVLFAHRGFEAPTPVRVALAVLGSMAGQGPVVYWASNHRLHHSRSDSEGDLHSPHVGIGGEPVGPVRGLWHAHVGWMFAHDPANPLVFSKDLLRDPWLPRISQTYYLWLLAGLLAPAVTGAVLGGWRGLWSGIVWGGLARMCLVQHATFAGNSVCHFFGEPAYDTGDGSTNVPWLTIPTWGGAMHNTHHAFPRSPVLGQRWWHFDLGGWIVLGLERIGLASDLKIPTPEQREARQRGAAP